MESRGRPGQCTRRPLQPQRPWWLERDEALLWVAMVLAALLWVALASPW